MVFPSSFIGIRESNPKFLRLSNLNKQLGRIETSFVTALNGGGTSWQHSLHYAGYLTAKPRRRGDWWIIQVRQDVVVNGKLKRSNKRVRLAPATMLEREVRKVAAEYLRPLNQGIQGIGSAVSFAQYVQQVYIAVVMPLLAKSTRDRYEGVLKNYLLPIFGELCLRDLTPLSVQKYSSNIAMSPLAHESRDKIRDVLSSVLASAVKYEFLVRNPVENVRMPAERRGKGETSPTSQF